MIVAPHFQLEEDEREDRDAYWTDSGWNSWKDGGSAVDPAGLSSFTAVDKILTTLADKDRFPLLTWITLVGHSAGGQFVQRYAAGGRAPDAFAGVTIGYVTANPSSYLYLNSYRPVAQNLIESCPEYNNYKYGLDNRNEYFNELSDEQIRRQYVSRRVTYLLGSADVHRDPDFETNCAANAQGNTRFHRGCLYYRSIQKFFPSAQHDMLIVPEVGHDHRAMFNSTQGKTAIFQDCAHLRRSGDECNRLRCCRGSRAVVEVVIKKFQVDTENSPARARRPVTERCPTDRLLMPP